MLHSYYEGCEKMKSFRIGDPENSGFNMTQLEQVSVPEQIRAQCSRLQEVAQSHSALLEEIWAKLVYCSQLQMMAAQSRKMALAI